MAYLAETLSLLTPHTRKQRTFDWTNTQNQIETESEIEIETVFCEVSKANVKAKELAPRQRAWARCLRAPSDALQFETENGAMGELESARWFGECAMAKNTESDRALLRRFLSGRF